MKKGLAVLIILMGFGTHIVLAQSWFEFFDTPEPSSVESIEYIDGKWFSFGASGACAQPKVILTDSTGQRLWELAQMGWFGSFRASEVYMDTVFAAGYDLIHDDTNDPLAYGFVYAFDTVGVVDTTVHDTLFNGGFHDIVLSDNRVFVSAAKNQNDIFTNNIGFVAAYDRQGNRQWTYQLGWPIKGLTKQGNSLFVYSADSIVTLSLQGQRKTAVSKLTSIVGIEPWKDALAVATTSQISLYDTSLTLLTTFDPTYVQLDRIDLINTNNHYISLAGTRVSPTNNFDYKIVSIDPFNSPFFPNYYLFADDCMPIKCLTSSQSNVTIGGEYVYGGYPSGYVVNNGVNTLMFLDVMEMEPISSAISVDSAIFLYYQPSTTTVGGTDAYYSASLTVNVTFQNRGFVPITSFLVHSGYKYDFCSLGSEIRLMIDSVNLAVGDSIQVEVKLQKEIVSGEPIEIDLYVIAENNFVNPQRCDTVPYPIKRVTYVGLDNAMEVGAIQLYPNPTQNRVYFSGLAQPATFTLHNLQGQQVFSQVAEPAMDVSQLSSGIYLYQITTNDGTLLKSGKLIKQH